MAGTGRVGVMGIVPALAERDDRQRPEVRGPVGGVRLEGTLPVHRAIAPASEREQAAPKAIELTAGVGEHAASLAGPDVPRSPSNAHRNLTGLGARAISPDDAVVAVCVVPTDEALSRPGCD